MNKELEQLFEICPYNTVSRFERQNFNEQTGAGRARYIIDVINTIRKIDSELSYGKSNGMKNFERNALLEEKETLLDFLNEQDIKELNSTVLNWQNADDDYWIEQLGKIAAIEIIANGKPSVETMTKMAKLPEPAYIKATQLCVKLANTIKAKTTQAEAEIGIGDDVADDSAYVQETTPVTKITLKKVKND